MSIINTTEDILRASTEAHTRFMRGDAYPPNELEDALSARYPQLHNMVRSRDYKECILKKMLTEMDRIRDGADPRRAEERVGQHMAELYVYPNLSDGRLTKRKRTL